MNLEAPWKRDEAHYGAAALGAYQGFRNVSFSENFAYVLDG